MSKKKLNSSPGATSVQELLNQLYQAAGKLRGSIEPSDYKRYVLPLIFLRFLSMRYERRLAELESFVNDPNSEYFQQTGITEDHDEYRRVGVFILPEEARWDSIVKISRADDIKIRLDNILDLLEKTYPDLRGLLPKIYAGSNMDRENLSNLIQLFSKDVFKADFGGMDLLGRIYEYFIGQFASSEGKRGGEYFTPSSIVKTLVAMLEPTEGIVYDPCCGSGGMFVQSEIFTKNSRQLSFYGQESKDFTYRLCRMNLFIHGLEGFIENADTYFNDKHPSVKADYILANPPFNDGSKMEDGWGAHKILPEDPRLFLNGKRLPLAIKNANTMWMLHFLHHLKEGGSAGFVMATGELSNGETSRYAVRKALIEADMIDCIVQLPAQLFANTQIPCALWFLAKNRKGGNGYRAREGEVLFIDARGLGELIPGSRAQIDFSEEDIGKISTIYREFKHLGSPQDIPSFARAATLQDILRNDYTLTPGRYIGTKEDEESSEDFVTIVSSLVSKLNGLFDGQKILQKQIQENLEDLNYVDR
jgi:type I restriction enzyme M protein